MRGLSIALLSCSLACSSLGIARTDSDQPAECSRALLAHTSRYTPAMYGRLPGTYRWYNVDTVSTRQPWPAAIEQKLRAGREIRLWRRSASARDSLNGAGNRKRWRSVGPIAGAITAFDTTGFSDEHPQIELPNPQQPFLTLLYDSRVGRGLLDGGHIMDILPIEVLGDWGFGGYYDSSGSLIAVRDKNGGLVPTFAGYYCAVRIGP